MRMSNVAASSPRPGPRPSNSREAIVQCAIRMLDREGGEALSFRAVARELEITVGALARYFKSLADLQDEVAAEIMLQLRPLKATSKLSLRDQLVRLGVDMLEINRAHPYLTRIHGLASATVIARHTRQCMDVLLEAGVDFERAMAIYSLVGNMAYAWGMQTVNPQSPEMQAAVTQAFSEQMGELFPQVKKLISAADGTVYRRWFQLYLDALLPAKTAAANKR
jgi:AcrR family transcriptional regulator